MARKRKEYSAYQKKCSRCDKIKSFECFCPCGTYADGFPKFKSECKECFNKKQKEKRDKLKTYISPYTDGFLLEVKNLFDQGLGKIKIAKSLGLHRCKINTAYKKLGLSNSEATKNRQNNRINHLLQEKYCTGCDTVKQIAAFEKFKSIDKNGRIHFRMCEVCEIKNNKEKSSKRYKEKLSKDLFVKLRMSVSTQIRNALKKQGSTKNRQACFKYLSYSLEELKINIEEKFEFWMNWDNYGMYNKGSWDDNDTATWTCNIDHIIPQSDLPFKSMKDDNFNKCWSLDNLRPYSSKQNIIDGATHIRHIK